MGVSKNDGTPKSSIVIGFFIINHPFWGTPIFGNLGVATLFFSTLKNATRIHPTRQFFGGLPSENATISTNTLVVATQYLSIFYELSPKKLGGIHDPQFDKFCSIFSDGVGEFQPHQLDH